MRTERRRAAWVAVLVVMTASVQPVYGATSCTMEFSLSGWSAFYQTASGHGTITCADGQSASVAITTKGGGLTFGKTKVADGHGTFSPVASIDELFGNYAKAEVQAGAGKSTGALVVTKGTVSLALAGKGTGIGVGFDFGRFTIERAKK